MFCLFWESYKQAPPKFELPAAPPGGIDVRVVVRAGGTKDKEPSHAERTLHAARSLLAKRAVLAPSLRKLLHSQPPAQPAPGPPMSCSLQAKSQAQAQSRRLRNGDVAADGDARGGSASASAYGCGAWNAKASFDERHESALLSTAYHFSQ